jgi:hypothetical protein
MGWGEQFERMQVPFSFVTFAEARLDSWRARTSLCVGGGSMLTREVQPGDIKGSAASSVSRIVCEWVGELVGGWIVVWVVSRWAGE